MNTSSISSLITTQISIFGLSALAILGAVLGIAIALLVFRFGIRALWHSDGTTNWLGRHWSWYDRHTYKPWKGYNRLHSAEWNMKNTL